MLTRRGFILTLLLAVPASARKGGRRHHTCPAELSDGPQGAAVEIRIGNLPPSISEEPVFLSWWAARESAVAYNPLEDPSKAEEYSGGSCKAYAEHGEPDFNGGKVRVTENGEATIRVKAPATYRGHRGGRSRRDPHVHFSICGQHGRPQKIVFSQSGVKVQVKGGCRKHKSSNTVSYKVLSARDINTGSVVELADTPVLGQQDDKKHSEEKDWDALEFSPIYQCLEGAELYDQFSSSCSTKCPAHAAMAHGQCVRKQVSTGNSIALTASWRLHLDCNDKCWADMIPASRHMVRIALADHLDITFQEARHVKLRRDPGSPTTHAHMSVRVMTSRLDEVQGSSLVKSFLSNASMVTDLLGLKVHEVAQVDDTDDQGSTLPGEISDAYAEYYAPLAADAENHAKDGQHTTIAGVEVPADVPVPAIVGAAAALVLALAALATWLHCRRSRQKAAGNAAKEGAEKAGKEVADKGIKQEEVEDKVEKNAVV